MLLLLHLQNGTILESPLDYIGFLLCLDELAALERRPELAEVLELDVVPDVAERGLDDGTLDHRGRSGNRGRHCGCLVMSDLSIGSSG